MSCTLRVMAFLATKPVQEFGPRGQGKWPWPPHHRRLAVRHEMDHRTNVHRGAGQCQRAGAGRRGSDARGMFLAGVGAGPVYELLGKKGLATAEFPPQDTALIDGEVA